MYFEDNCGEMGYEKEYDSCECGREEKEGGFEKCGKHGKDYDVMCFKVPRPVYECKTICRRKVHEPKMKKKCCCKCCDCCD